MSKFVDAYSTATGQKVRVPARWLDHPRLSKGLRKTPLRRAAETRAARPTPTPPAGDNKKEES